MTGRRAVIAGGGIGGLSAALALVARGWQVEVYERAPVLEEIGAGVQLSPNGVRILEALGVMDRLWSQVFEPDAIEMRIGATGRQVFRLPMAEAARARWGAAYVQVHRADLSDALRAELEARAPGSLKLGRGAMSYDRVGALTLTDGERVGADLIVGADGVHSVLRNQMFGADPARYTGSLAWRAVVPADQLDVDVPPTGCIWAGPGKHAVTTRVRGGSMVNFVGIIERPDVSEEGWRVRGTPEDALRDFGDWSPVLRGVIEAAPALWRWALLGRDPLPRWSDGRVILLGDAAHPMVPSMAQGAVQAIEDGWVLADELDKTPDIERALAATFARRIARVSRVQHESLKNLAMFHRRGLAQAAVYGPLWLVGKCAPGLLHRRLDWLYGGTP